MAFLTKAQELELIRQYKKEKNKARKKLCQDKIIMNNVNFARHCGMKYFWRYRKLYNRANLNIEDAKSSAIFGLVTSLKNFKPSKRVKFNTFAYHHIRKQLQRELFKELKYYNYKEDESRLVSMAVEAKNIPDINLSLLAKKERKLIRERFFKFKTYKEMGRDYDLSYETVRKKIKEILNKLKLTNP